MIDFIDQLPSTPTFWHDVRFVTRKATATFDNRVEFFALITTFTTNTFDTVTATGLSITTQSRIAQVSNRSKSIALARFASVHRQIPVTRETRIAFSSAHTRFALALARVQIARGTDTSQTTGTRFAAFVVAGVITIVILQANIAVETGDARFALASAGSLIAPG